MAGEPRSTHNANACQTSAAAATRKEVRLGPHLTSEFEAMTRGGHMATEVVWYNYPTPIELHDYRYLGDGFRERERIKRKTARWTAKLAKMPVLERQALMAAMSVLP